MIPQIEKLLTQLSTKTSWGVAELTTIIKAAEQSLATQMSKDEQVIVAPAAAKKIKTDTIKKYDILYMPIVGMPHYFLVHRVTEDKVYGVLLSSKNKAHHTLQKLECDRFFIQNEGYASNSYLAVDLAEAKDCFIRVYESRQEADNIFKGIKQHYKELFKL